MIQAGYGEISFSRKILRSAFAKCNGKVSSNAFSGDASDRIRFKKLQAQNRAYFIEKGKKKNTCS
jgi:hypothetical protein